MISAQIDTDEFNRRFREAWLASKRSLQEFIRGQSYNLVGKISWSLKDAQAKKKQIDADIGQVIGRNRGVRVRETAWYRAVSSKQGLNGGGWFQRSKSHYTKLKSGCSTPKGRNYIYLNTWALAVRYEWGLRRSGVGSVRAGWIAILQAVSGVRKDSARISESFSNKASGAWKSSMTFDGESFQARVISDSLSSPRVVTGVQRGVNRAEQNIAAHLAKKLQNGRF